MKLSAFFLHKTCFCAILFLCTFFQQKPATAQSPAWKAIAQKPATLGLEEGFLTFNIPGFKLQLVKASQTVASLAPNNVKDFDFTPKDRLAQRDKDGMYQLGDLNLRLRTAGDTSWKTYATATKRAAVQSLILKDKNVLAAANLAATFPADMPLQVQRLWKLEGGKLVLLFNLKNTGKQAVEIGSLGMPMIFNNIMEDKTLEQTHAQNVFYDPYIGKDAGYLQVTRLSGKGPALLVVPVGHTSFEAYNPLLSDPTPRGIVFEGFYEWMVHSKAYAENEWQKAQPWNVPTSAVIKPGQQLSYGVKFILADNVKDIEPKLVANNRPVAVGIPGYVLPQDVDARLFLTYKSKVQNIRSEPEGALIFKEISAKNSITKCYQINGKTWGRARLTITYADGLSQTINYKIIKPEKDLVADYGRFLTNQQWYENKADPFKRDQSAITYDYETKRQVSQDSRVWIAGLSDEGGAGSWLGAMMKELVQPDKTEIDKLQRFVNHTLWGQIQLDTGKQKYGVKKSIFYYQPDEMPAGTYSDSINYKTWAAWSHKAADDVGRSYNYPHVAAAYWTLYRLSRNHVNLVTEQNWKWYLKQAYQTSMAMVNLAPYYVQFGQMEGTVFYLILMDLKAEGYTQMAETLEKAMKVRADHWRTLLYPFGSEMPWDSTGQEEVYQWSSYFGYDDKAATTISAILAYMPTVPHWGYNGSARRYWDFLYGGKLSRVERQLHHYGSGLNAIPVLSEYRKNPDDLYLLRVGYGGLLGSVSNITEDGFGSAAFHAFPSTLKIDGLSGDYGSSFFGYAVNTATYITPDKKLGWLAFGGNLKQEGEWINVKITTAAKSKIYLAPVKLCLLLDAGTFDTVSFNTKTRQLKVLLDKADDFTPVAHLSIRQINPSKQTKKYTPNKKFMQERGWFVIPLGATRLSVSLQN